MGAYYNEFDPFAAEWLRQLIKAGHIAPGEVDERSIEDVLPSDLRPFKQCHFFAGIGVWSYALRKAGWPDDREVWTGSCPCQPFSAAGKRGGVTDARHLWPSLFGLVRINRPPVLFGEQVASKDGLSWLDSVQTDMEAANYSFGALDLCAAGFGAPHIRQRLYFVADSKRGSAERWRYDLATAPSGTQEEAWQRERIWHDAGAGEFAGELDHSAAERLSKRSGEEVLGWSPRRERQRSGDAGRFMEDTECSESARIGLDGRPLVSQQETNRSRGSSGIAGFWGEPDWVFCSDEKYRPVEPGTFPLAHGATNRVGRLRGYGNALCAPVAQGFIEAYMETL